MSENEWPTMGLTDKALEVAADAITLEIMMREISPGLRTNELGSAIQFSILRNIKAVAMNLHFQEESDGGDS